MKITTKTWRVAAVAIAATLIPTIYIPERVAASVGDAASERELTQAHVRSVFLWTGRRSLIPGRWFEFRDMRTMIKYKIKKGAHVKARFPDRSSVELEFIGTVFQCPSGMCFTWVDGTEHKPRKPVRKPRIGTNDHPGKEKGHDHFVYTGSTPLPSAPLNPYDESTWAGPAPSFDTSPTRGGGGGGRRN